MRRRAGLGGLLRVALLTVVVSVDVVFGTWAMADPSSRPSALLSLDMFWQEEISVNFSVLEATRGACPRTFYLMRFFPNEIMEIFLFSF